MVSSIKDNAIKAIESPIFGNKLKRDEQAAIYDLIAEPDEQSKGYAIFSAIDTLFEKGDFEKLKKEALINYIGTASSHKTAENLQKKLRVAAEFRTSKGDLDEDKQVIHRKKYDGKFGRG